MVSGSHVDAWCGVSGLILGFGVRYMIWGLGIMVNGLCCMVQGQGCRVKSLCRRLRM